MQAPVRPGTSEAASRLAVGAGAPPAGDAATSRLSPLKNPGTSGVLAIIGSGDLIRSLIAADLIDEYLVMIHPIVLGTGPRLRPFEPDTANP